MQGPAIQASHATSNLRSNRSKAYYYIFSGFYIAEILASGIASITLDISPWIPCGLAFGALLLCLVVLTRIPERHSVQENEEEIEQTRSLIKSNKATSFRQALTNRNILFALPTFFVGSIRYSVLNLLMQYASVRFGFSISRTALFYTEMALVNMVLFLFVVPRLTTLWRTQYSFDPQRIDLGLVRISVCLLSIGALSLAISPSGEVLLGSELYP